MANFTLTTGSDSFAGGSDDDQFSGPPGGTDTLSGGGGADSFNYSASGDPQGGTIDGGDGIDTVVTGRLDAVTFSNVEILNTVYGFLGNAAIAQLLAFQTIDASSSPGGQIAITLDARAGGTIDFSARLSAGHGLFLNALLATSAVTVTGTALADEFVSSAFADSFTGGAGDDTYRLDSAADTVIENAGGGHDTIVSTVSRSLAGTPEIEDLSFTESGNFTGTGNALANTITGYFGNDTLSGGAGADTLKGAEGNDTYIDPQGDTIVELAPNGIDTVRSSASFSLGPIANVEWLVLTGAAASNGTGNALANYIVGNDSNNVLAGGAGSDTLIGGGGVDQLRGGTQRDKLVPGTDTHQDVLIFTALNDSTGVTRDVITGLDLNAEDRLDLPAVPTAIAATVTVGNLTNATFNIDLAAAVNAAALPVGNAVLFDPSGGDLNAAGMVYLIVDANGIAGYQANQDWVFQLENHTGTLTTNDFV